MNSSNPANSGSLAAQASAREPAPPANHPAPGVGARPDGVGARVFQNTAVQLVGRAASLLLSAATSILLARYLGHERMGQYGAIYAYLTLYSFLATYGLGQILAREASLRRSEAAQIFYTGTLLALGFAVLGGVLAPLLAPLFGYSGELRWLIAVAAVDILILPPFCLPGIVFQVDMRQWFSVGIFLVRQALWLVALVLLVTGQAAFFHVIVARTLCGVVEAALIVVFSRRAGLLEGPRRFLREDARRMLRDASPLVMNAIAVSIFYRIDQVMLHNMTGDRVLGPYVIAVQLVELFSTIPGALMSSLFPALSRTANDAPLFLHYLGTSYRFLLFVVFGLCATIAPVAAPMILFLYGRDYLPTAALLIVLIWSEVPLFFGTAISHALVAKGLQRYLPAATVVGAVSNIALNLVVIPRYGAIGASWATVVSYSLSGIFMYLLFQQTRPLTLQGLRIAWPLFLLALGINVALYFVSWAYWWKLLTACALYIAGAALAGILRKSEVDRFLLLLRLRKSSSHSESN
ncbi:MAG: flippase [Acidobacteriia bacterium]|nr:flippase [Terriglobia bacterium]